MDARCAKASTALRGLRRIHREHGRDAADRKLALLRVLARGALPRARNVLQLHEVLRYLSAYPDSPALLRAVRRMLAAFAQRPDLRAHCEELADTGITGTAIHCDFYWFTAEWLTRRWPGQVTVDWDGFEAPDRLDALMYPILQEHERLAYEGTTRSLREIIDVLRAPGETDAAYLIGTFRRLRIDPMILEQVYESIGLTLRLAPGTDTPSRTRARFPVTDVEYQTQPISQPEGTVRERIERDQVRVRSLPVRDGRKLVQLGREAMITRGRDLFAFIHADPRDAHLVDFGEGLQFSCVGLVPERRHLLYGQYILMALRNGIPVGYVQTCVLFDSAEINFNVFDTFRGAEASRIFTSALALVRHLFGVDAFTINTQQLGQDNRGALESGAWWFYYKHGFRPRHADLAPIVRRELAAKRRNAAHRSSIRTLEKLSSGELDYTLDGPSSAASTYRGSAPASPRASASAWASAARAPRGRARPRRWSSWACAASAPGRVGRGRRGNAERHSRSCCRASGAGRAPNGRTWCR